MLLVSECVPVGVWCRAVVRGRYRSQLLGAALLILGGGAVQVVMLGAAEVMATEPGWDLAAVGVGSSWSGGRSRGCWGGFIMVRWSMQLVVVGYGSFCTRGPKNAVCPEVVLSGLLG